MIKSVKITCSCGCEKECDDSPKWLVLSELHPNKSGDHPKLDEKLYFSSLECLSVWAFNAKMVSERLQRVARHFPLHGQLSDKNVHGVYI